MEGSAPVCFTTEISTTIQASISLVGEANGCWVDDEIDAIESTDVNKSPVHILPHLQAERNLVMRQGGGMCSQCSKEEKQILTRI